MSDKLSKIPIKIINLPDDTIKGSVYFLKGITGDKKTILTEQWLVSPINV